MLLKYSKATGYKFLNDNDPILEEKDCYYFKGFVKKIYSAQFVKRATTYKRVPYRFACIKLIYGVEFKNSILYLRKDIAYHSLIKKTIHSYLVALKNIAQFDKELTKRITCSENDKRISKELSLLIESLYKFAEEDVLEMDMANGESYIWEHNINNPKYIKVGGIIDHGYIINGHQLVKKSTGRSFDLTNAHKECKIAEADDKRRDAIVIKMYYRLRLNNGSLIYLYRDVVRKTLTLEMTATYLSYIKNLIQFDEQLSKVITQNNQDQTISHKLKGFKEFLESFEGYSIEDKKYEKAFTKRINKAANGYSVMQFMLWDEIWGD